MRWYERLRRSSDIASVRRRGRRSGGPLFAAFGVLGGDRTAVAVSVSKAVGNAVVRNTVRRRVRGALDASPPVPAGLRVLFVARPAAAQAPYAAVAADVARIMRELAAVPVPARRGSP